MAAWDGRLAEMTPAFILAHLSPPNSRACSSRSGPPLLGSEQRVPLGTSESSSIGMGTMPLSDVQIAQFIVLWKKATGASIGQSLEVIHIG